MKTHRDHARALLLLLAWQLLMPISAAAYSVMLRWDAPADPAVIGYRLYVREGDAEYGAPRDVLPEAGSDGRFATVLSNLVAAQTYTFAVSAYTADGRESERSNERSLGYGDVAALVDSDGDGLTDAAEDVNLNGAQDAAETDRLIADSDGDLVGDGIERARGTDPLDALSPACEPLRFAEFGYSARGGTAEVMYDAALNATVLRATETARKPLRFRGNYPARGAVALQAPILVTELRSDRRFRIELTVRSTIGKRYTLRYEGNGGVDRRAGRTLTTALGTEFAASDGYTPIARDVAADLARLRPDAVLATITNIRIKGGYTMSELHACG